MQEVNGSGRVGSSRWQEVEGREGGSTFKGTQERAGAEPRHSL